MSSLLRKRLPPRVPLLGPAQEVTPQLQLELETLLPPYAPGETSWDGWTPCVAVGHGTRILRLTYWCRSFAR